ncbi:hypothetical protein [Pelomonas sp. SE-A7]|uniref:hypothetical protein n=1 Tax=Pelomonas sp. SE-A7 TaxID=3054953 RepID=UPI00259D0C7E|nr:hypothetical protein [Pelomonas sp. SE-A7]MDM4768059.1 hypothetical protein [Pelomonas sp. SE-A7]
MSESKPFKLEKHVLSTYYTLRLGIALVALAFPFVLWIGGEAWAHFDPPGSMSAYYHAASQGRSMRDWFVGLLFAIGIFLFLYKGYSRRENIALNLAGGLAVLVALIPMAWDGQQNCNRTSLHGTLSVLFFVCISYVCIWCAGDTLHMVEDQRKREHFLLIYRLCAAGMVLFPAAAFALNYRSDCNPVVPLFYVEASGVICFALYWWFKGREMALTQAEARAIRGELEL